MSVLGVYDGHNAGAALIGANGVVLAAVEEERFSRIKNHDARPGHDAPPLHSVSYCVAQCTNDDPITLVAFGIQHPDDLARTALGNFDARVAAGERQRLLRASELGITDEELRDLPRAFQVERAANLQRVVAAAGVDAFVPTAHVDHHAAHAGGAFLLSGVDRALVITLDGKGDDLSGTVSVGDAGFVERIFALSTEDSLGHLYSAFTVACGLRPQRDEGKLQAMAASGKSSSYLRSWLDDRFTLDGESGIIRGRLNDGLVVGPFPDRLPDLHNELVGRAIAGIPEADAAATVQEFLERIVCDFASWHLARSALRKLVVAGGIFANVGLNRRLAELTAVDELHVHPAMTDAGIALGAAAVAAAERGIGLSPIASVALGPGYSEDEAGQAFASAGYRIEHPAQSAERTLAGRLAAGEVVARFVGRAEYGPRALGHRSIFAPASDPRMPAILNQMLNRSTVMPFAPLARRKDEQALFKPNPALAAPTRYMAAAMLCHEETRFRYPAIVHADGTARPQFVSEGALVDLLDELERLAGDCVVINTSFNRHDEPMVCGPEDAARSARMAAIHTVQVGSLIAVLP